MKSRNVRNKKSSAQAMVEFAIALPILLALLYGILETGRFLFLYSTVVTASRQAVRYGTATGTGTGTVPRYQDCDGIRQVANNAGYLGAFDTIILEHDDGPGGPVTPYCAGATDTWVPTSANTDRLVVTVTEQFTPLVPNFVPFIQRDIVAKSARTILVSVSIVVTAPPSGGGGGGSGDIELNILSPGTYSDAGEIIIFTYQVTNTSTTDDLDTSALSITTDTGSASCSGAPATLAPGASFDCAGSYTTTQSDMDAGSFTVSATANAGSASDSDTETLTGTFSPALTLDKAGPTYAKAQNNTPVDYTYTLTNSGNVTLGPPYTVTDDKVASNNLTCPSSGDIAPGASTTCTGTYTLRNSDINAGSITNMATATATFGAQTITSNSDTWLVITPPVFLSVTASQASVTTVGQTIAYTYTLRNNISSNMRAPYAVIASLVTNETCPGVPTPLAPNNTITCTGSYTVTQADLDAGVPLTSTINASAIKATNPGAGNNLTSNTVSFSVPVTQNPALTMTVSAAPNPATVLNTVVTYTYTLTNSGNVTLSSPSITDDKAIATCADTSPIAPGATRVCTGTRTISQADLDDGSVISTTTATTTLGAGIVSSNTVSTTVTTFVGARLTLVITSNPPTAVGPGVILTFTYTLKNTGNVVLTSPYSAVSSNIAGGSGDCSAAAGSSIPVGGSVACIGFYTTTATDVTNGSVTNLATATAMDGATTVTSNNASVTVTVTP